MTDCLKHMIRRGELLKTADELGAGDVLPALAVLPVDTLEAVVDAMREIAAAHGSAMTDDAVYERLLRAEAATLGFDPDKFVRANLKGAK